MYCTDTDLLVRQIPHHPIVILGLKTHVQYVDKGPVFLL